MGDSDLKFPQDYLHLNDIYLWSSTFERENPYESAIHDGKTIVQRRQEVSADILDVETVDGESAKLLRALISFGVRVVSRASNPDEETKPLHTIEATFAVEYVVENAPTKAQLDEFCEFNCTHNVWPFWRQHVFALLKNASLPMVTVPFFPGNKKKSGAGAKPRQRKKIRK